MFAQPTIFSILSLLTTLCTSIAIPGTVDNPPRTTIYSTETATKYETYYNIKTVDPTPLIKARASPPPPSPSDDDNLPTIIFTTDRNGAPVTVFPAGVIDPTAQYTLPHSTGSSKQGPPTQHALVNRDVPITMSGHWATVFVPDEPVPSAEAGVAMSSEAAVTLSESLAAPTFTMSSKETAASSETESVALVPMTTKTRKKTVESTRTVHTKHRSTITASMSAAT